MRCLLFAIAAAHILTADPFQDTADPFQDTSEPAPYTFGTSVVDSAGLQGRIYDLPANTSKLPDFRRLTPVGTIYTSSLNVWPQSFTQGFPGITDRDEWFGIEYTGKIYVEKPGTYRFSILSDDGARLRLNNKTPYLVMTASMGRRR